MHNKYQTLGPSPRSLHLNSTPLWGSLLGTCSPLLGPGCAMAKFLLNETSRKNPTGDSQYETWFQMKTWKSWKDMWPQCQNPRTEYVRSNDVWCVSSGDLDILNMRGHQLWHFSQQCVCIYIYRYMHSSAMMANSCECKGQANHGLCRSSHSNSNLLKLY